MDIIIYNEAKKLRADIETVKSVLGYYSISKVEWCDRDVEVTKVFRLMPELIGILESKLNELESRFSDL